VRISSGRAPGAALAAGQHHPGRRDAGGTGQAEQLPQAHGPTYCAEPVTTASTAMGLLDGRRPRNAHDPGSSWSGDDLQLLPGATLGPEIVPAAQPSRRTR
jgi:hypothetical protein